MDCRNCQPTLIDLLHGELATDAAEDAREHLRHCASCSSAYERLASGLRVGRTLEIEEPPAAVTARILEVAEAHARATVARQEAARSAAPNTWRSLIDFVSRFAMARQVGMVTISLLIVAVGLLSLPRRGSAPSGIPAVAGGTVLNPEAAEEAVPSGGVRPAERLPLKMDARSGRILSKDEQPPAAALAAQAPSPSAMPAPLTQATAAREAGAIAQPKPEKKATNAGRRADQYDVLDGLVAPPASDALARAKRSAVEGTTGAGAAPSAFPKNQSAGLGTLASNADRPNAQRAASADKGSVAEAEFAAAPAAPPPATAAHATAETKRKSAAAPECGAQSARYEQAMGADPTGLAAGQAMIALAECRTALGQTALARPLLERATRIEGVAARARELI
jgi:hypothetical protein